MSVISRDLRPQLIAGKTTGAQWSRCSFLDAVPDLVLLRRRARSRRANHAVDQGNSYDPDHRGTASLIEGFVRAILSPVLQNHGLAKARVGVDEANISLLKCISSCLPGVQVEDGDTAMHGARGS